MDGRIEAGWTFDRNDETVTEEHALSDEAFGMLWDGIAASLREGGFFRACLFTDPARLIDPALYHVITTVQVQDGRVLYWTFMVPSGEVDPVFTAWLEALAVSGGARAKERISVRKLPTLCSRHHENRYPVSGNPGIGPSPGMTGSLAPQFRPPKPLLLPFVLD